MAARHGVFSFDGQTVKGDAGAPAGIYPGAPTVPLSDWGALHRYYLDASPGSPVDPAAGRPDVKRDIPWFEVETPGQAPSGLPLTSCIFIDESKQRIVAGDASGKRLLVFDAGLELVHSVSVSSPPVAVSPHEDGSYWVTLIGSVPPSEKAEGAVVRVVVPSLARASEPSVSVVLENLQRPVGTVLGDFDGDGSEDALVCCFGFYTGELALFRGSDDGSFTKETIISQPGATAALPGALGGGRDSVLVLMAQADERIVHIEHIADAERRRESVVLRSPPSLGSSGIEVVDFDRDGDPDILYTAGDNADYSPVFKADHGVYLYVNNGGEFREAFFFPMHGAYRAVAEDFDGDGDHDIAAIAYFGDYGSASGVDRGFVYLENRGTKEGDDGRAVWSFVPRTLPGLCRRGRFIALDAGDIDGDDDIDLVLANFAFGPTGAAAPPQPLADEWMGGPRFVVLRNTVED